MDRKVILLELNEVPFRVIDGYCMRRSNSTLAQMLTYSSQFISVTEDKLALDPWISWSTLHRGVNDEMHNILHLGQVIDATDAAFPPIWRLLSERGLSVGVFGSLHSSNVPEDVSKYSFYLPDYFDDTVFASPKSLAPFQKLNLSMTRQSARNVSRKIPWVAAVQFAATSPLLGLRLSTLAELAMHLAKEARNVSLRIRRRVYQPLIMMDLFLKQLRRTKPQFASFYTNHVAAAMHRYWGATFPEDYGSKKLDDVWIAKYQEEIWFAMDKFDLMLRPLKRFIDNNPGYTLIVASSMGQGAIPAEKTFQFLTITDISKFMYALGVPADGWHQRPAMVPCCCVVIDEKYRIEAMRNIRLLSVDGNYFRQDQKPFAPMSYDERSAGSVQLFVQFDNYKGSNTAIMKGKEITLASIGLGFIVHEDGVNCTAQHVADGSLFVYAGMHSKIYSAGRATVSTLDVVPSIMRFLSLEKPAYMRGSASIDLVNR